MVAAGGAQRGVLAGAAVERDRAAGVEAAAARDHGGVGRLPLEELRAGARRRVALGHHREQRPGVGVARATIAFLLDREPPGSIMPSFDCTVVPRYFPEYEAELPGYLQG